MSGNIDFDKIFNAFYPKVLHYVSRLTNNHEAEDITQEVFEKINRGLSGFKGESSLSTWIYRIATNTALDRLKSQSFKHAGEELREETEGSNVWREQKKAPVDQQLIRKEMSECVKERIDRLPPDYNSNITQ